MTLPTAYSWSAVGQALRVPYEAPQGRRINVIGGYFLELPHFGGSSDLSVQGLGGQQDAPAQQLKRSSTIHAALDQFDFRHCSLEPAIAPG
jgi:hypothetical protein